MQKAVTDLAVLANPLVDAVRVFTIVVLAASAGAIVRVTYAKLVEQRDEPNADDVPRWVLVTFPLGVACTMVGAIAGVVRSMVLDLDFIWWISPFLLVGACLMLVSVFAVLRLKHVHEAVVEIAESEPDPDPTSI